MALTNPASTWEEPRKCWADACRTVPCQRLSFEDCMIQAAPAARRLAHLSGHEAEACAVWANKRRRAEDAR